jgi:hypothetical protein
MASFSPEEKQIFDKQKLLDQQKIITETATNFSNESKMDVERARIVLEEAQKIYDDLVIAMTSYKTHETKETTILSKLQCEIDEMKAAVVWCKMEDMVSPGKITGFDRPKPRTELEWQQCSEAMLKNDEEEEDPCINEMGVHCCCVCCTKGCCRCDRYQ